MLHDDVRRRLPIFQSRYPTSPLIARRLGCYECMGGARNDAINCTVAHCYHWPHRGAGWDKVAIASGARPADWRDRFWELVEESAERARGPRKPDDPFTSPPKPHLPTRAEPGPVSGKSMFGRPLGENQPDPMDDPDSTEGEV